MQSCSEIRDNPILRQIGIDIRKKIATTTLVLGGRTITKEIVLGKKIIRNKGMEAPTVTETDGKTQEISAEFLPS
jgi:hypothetical protein